MEKEQEDIYESQEEETRRHSIVIKMIQVSWLF